MTTVAATSVHELTMTVLMTPGQGNFSGNVHGGTLLKIAGPGGLRVRQPLRRLPTW